MAPRETEENAYAKVWGDKQRALWYVMVFWYFWCGQFIEDTERFAYATCSL